MSLGNEKVRTFLADFGFVLPQQQHHFVESGQDVTKSRPPPSTSLDVNRAPKPSTLIVQPQPRLNNNGLFQNKIPQEVLEELYDRFLRHAPEDEQCDIIRICFNIEKAHWFYIDNYCSDQDHSGLCPNVSQKEFFRIVFRQAPLEIIARYQSELSAVLEEFGSYKTNVPTYGACILNRQRNKVLLVLSFSDCYGFPKGKINQGESPVACAAREVEEEVGIDVRDRIDANEYLEIEKRTPRGKMYTRLYIVDGLEEQRRVAGPKMKGEVRKVVWWPIDELIEQVSAAKRSRFWAVEPFIEPLREWLLQRSDNNQENSKIFPRDGAASYMGSNVKEFFDRSFTNKNGITHQHPAPQPARDLRTSRPANGYPSTRRMRVHTAQN